ncbi:MAG: class I SAM-dependent methyltransferase, partial [Gammaproteobacteria bacterium]|nr:class I SAM-dependent methyltransferase [Gammaproteobacteria bacterium]
MSETLLSHQISPEKFDIIFDKTRKRILEKGDQYHVTVSKQLELLDQLSQFDFGRFIIQNQGLNGYWTHYALLHPKQGKITGKNNQGVPFSELEKFMLNKCPVFLATQQRFEIFLNENQKSVSDNANLACIPCGMMGELFYLNFDNVNNIKLTGIDYDKNTLQDSKALADQRNLSKHIELMQKDAWNLNINNEFDLISSNGLNIYEPDDSKVTQLYKQFYAA